jgi:hypothetical protein
MAYDPYNRSNDDAAPVSLSGVGPGFKHGAETHDERRLQCQFPLIWPSRLSIGT